jgi:hypothetical protein
MASLRIPKKYHAGIAQLLSLPDEQFGMLISNLKRAPFSFELGDAIRRTVRSTDGIPSNNVSSIADGLVSLLINRANSDETTSEFVESLAEGIVESRSEALEKFRETSETVLARLAQIYEADSVVLAAKASSVMFEYDHIFYKSRVLTDIRPVFGESTRDAKAFMVIHNLRIHYHEGEAHKDFFVALDTKDIQKLTDTLERAKAKADTLKSILASANIPYIEPESE